MPRLPFGGVILPAPELNDALDDVRQTVIAPQDSLITSLGGTPPYAVGFTLPIKANAWYALDSCILYSATTTADFAIILKVPFRATIGVTSWGAPTTATTTTNTVDMGFNTSSPSIIMAVGTAGAGVTMAARAGGYVVTGTYSGTLDVLFNFNFSETSNLVLKQGSTFSLSRVL